MSPNTPINLLLPPKDIPVPTIPALRLTLILCEVTGQVVLSGARIDEGEDMGRCETLGEAEGFEFGKAAWRAYRGC